MLFCDFCVALVGRDSATAPHMHLTSIGTMKQFDYEIKSYQCTQCGTEWGLFLTGINGHWIRRVTQPSAQC